MATNHGHTFWSGQRVLVTGATGIVGSWLVKDLLSRGASVVALVRDFDPQSELIRSGDINKISVVSGALEDLWTLERALNEFEIETVFHLGAQPIVGVAQRMSWQTFESNIRGTYNLLEACRFHKKLVKRVVVASSDKAYGEQKNLPYTEDMPLEGRYPYEVSKSCADLITQSYFHSHGIPTTIARCGNIYGGGDLNWSRIVPGTIRSCLLGERPIIRSDGTYVRDYIFVKDVVRAYERLAECMDNPKVKGQAFNFSPAKALTVRELVTTIQKIMGTTELKPIVQDNVEGEIHSQYLSSAKAAKLLSWKPEYSLNDGLVETVEWYKDYLVAHLGLKARVESKRGREKGASA